MCVLDEDRGGGEGAELCVCARIQREGAGLTCNILNGVIPSHAHGFNLSLIKSK